MENQKIEKVTVDGRRTEIHVSEQPMDGVTHRITEHYEEIIPLEKRKKVVERIVPVVVERVTEQYNGNEVNKFVEKVAEDEPMVRLSLSPEPQKPITLEQIEAVFRRLQQNNVAIPKPELPVPETVKTDITNHPIVSYVLVTLLAVVVGFNVWQFFIR